MIRLADIPIRPKLVFFFILVGLSPLILVSLFGTSLSKDALIEKSFNELHAIQTIRKAQIERAMEERFSDLTLISKSLLIRQAVTDLDKYQRDSMRSSAARFDKESAEYKEIEKKYRAKLKGIITPLGYRDLLLISPRMGHVQLTAEGRNEVGTNLAYGRLKDSALAEAWRSVMETGKTAFVDFSEYAPLDGKQTAFIAAPVMGEGDSIKGVIALGLSPQFITDLVDSTNGMGETGESYLLTRTRDTEEFELRSNIKTLGDGKYVVGYILAKPLNYWLEAVRKGRAGGEGVYTDSAGKKVLAAYNLLEIRDSKWYLISKMDRDEVMAPVNKIIDSIILTGAILALLIAFGAWSFSRRFTKPLLDDVRFAEAVAAGELDKSLELNQKDELGALAGALNNMAASLRNVDWLKRGKEGLDDELRGEHTTDELTSLLISFVVKHMDAQLGAVYLNSNGVLNLVSSYAFTDRNGNFSRIPLGEGMIGQAAKEQKMVVYSHMEEDVPLFNYGVGESKPNHFIVVPIVLEGKLLGVYLVGAMKPIDDLQRTFLASNTENIAMLFNMAQSRQTIARLLEEAQTQQEELKVSNEELEEQAEALKASEAQLQTQQEELRVTNEELEEQTRALKESEAELQAQQEELRVTNEELEERTQALEEQREDIRAKNDALVQAQDSIQQKAKDLEIASKYKSEFLANMSHELRTPLNSILILSQLFGQNKEENLTEKQIESANAIHSSGSDLLNLINEILDLSKVEAGKIELILENVSFEAIVKDLKRVFDDVAKDKKLQFKTSVAEDLPDALHTDSQRLQQVLRNLLTNAFKFTSEGTVSVDIMSPDPELLKESSCDPKEMVAFVVADDGIGIPDEKRAAIFEAFQQADGSTSRKYGGTGLGLSISRELSKLLGGSIHLSSNAGQGSVFTVIVPLSGPQAKGICSATSVEKNVEKSSDTTSSPASEPATVSSDVEVPASVISTPVEQPVIMEGSVEDDRKNIAEDDRVLLIIEDDKHFVKVLRDFARERGFKCLIAENGETGLHFADMYRPSAIALDIGLPGIDGWTVMERLKENPDLRHIPVHFMSADDSSLDAMRMGAVGFLTKPVSMQKVEDAFGRIESIITRPVRKLLVVEDDEIQRESIKELIGNGDVETITVGTGKEAFAELTRERYDCMILDLGLEDMTGFELMEKIRMSDTCSRVPIIVYTGRDLTREEDKELQKYTESIIVKGAKSPERLLDESALFLHRVEANLPAEKQRMLKMVHDKEAVLADKKVLLVDDDMRNVFALSSILEDKSMEVVIARNGLEALDQLEKERNIDLVLMDIMMPQMDGYEAMTEIRKQKKFEKLPIIALTAKAMKGDRSKCIEAGASDYLAKPVDTAKLLSMLRVWLY
ncbi:MAG: response regulator [Desulfovibrio sp.]